MKKILVSRKQIEQLNTDQIMQMWELYECNYECISYDGFIDDLFAKDFVFLGIDPVDKSVGGFCTVSYYFTKFQNKKVSVIFTGDTMFKPEYWGSSGLNTAMSKFITCEKFKHPGRLLYWNLIASGNKTYLSMAKNCHEYFPRYDKQTPDFERGLMDHIGELKFKEIYNPKTAVIEFSQKTAVFKNSPMTVKIMKLPEIKHFVTINPGHAKGNELMCLAHFGFKSMASVIMKTARKCYKRKKKAIKSFFVPVRPELPREDLNSIFINKPFVDIGKTSMEKDDVVDIRLLYVTPGVGIVNKYGHLLYHIVRRDGLEDIVVSYRGHVDDVQMSNMKGILGGYELKPFVFTLGRAKFEYTTNLNRKMISYKLKTTQSELEELRQAIINDYWNYNTDYNFILKNCSSTLVKTLKQMTSLKISFLKTLVPSHCIASLIKTGIINDVDTIEFENIQEDTNKVFKEYITHKKREDALLQHFSSREEKLEHEFELLELIRGQFILKRDSNREEATLNLSLYKELEQKLNDIEGIC